jgi:hypothetical protein
LGIGRPAPANEPGDQYFVRAITSKQLTAVVPGHDYTPMRASGRQT